jgi:GAF domain-containing protein
MAEALLDVRREAKDRAYALLHTAAVQLLGGSGDEISAMASVSALLHNGFGFLWTGFYRLVTPALLRVGPYQGTVGCLEIPLGRGVCGTAAAEGRTIIVPDVRRFPGHIACDARSRSEIVVPVYSGSGALTAVLDIDSEHLATFDERDIEGLERLVTLFRDLSG